jgi:hypothetical protein
VQHSSDYITLYERSLWETFYAITGSAESDSYKTEEDYVINTLLAPGIDKDGKSYPGEYEVCHVFESHKDWRRYIDTFSHKLQATATTFGEDASLEFDLTNVGSTYGFHSGTTPDLYGAESAVSAVRACMMVKVTWDTSTSNITEQVTPQSDCTGQGDIYEVKEWGISESGDGDDPCLPEPKPEAVTEWYTVPVTLGIVIENGTCKATVSPSAILETLSKKLLAEGKSLGTDDCIYGLATAGSAENKEAPPYPPHSHGGSQLSMVPPVTFAVGSGLTTGYFAAGTSTASKKEITGANCDSNTAGSYVIGAARSYSVTVSLCRDLCALYEWKPPVYL